MTGLINIEGLRYLKKHLYTVKSRAKKKGLFFDLDFEWVLKNIRGECPVLGIPLKLNTGEKGDDSISIDRVENSKGYTKANCQIISYRANRLKSDANINEIKAILEYMEKHSSA